MKTDLEKARKKARESADFQCFVPITRKEIFGALTGTAIICGALGFGVGVAVCRRGARRLEVVDA